MALTIAELSPRMYTANATPNVRARIVAVLPLLAWALWIAVTAVGVWQHARASEQPPVYDAATYAQKAQNFWAKVDARRPFNPLNVEPTFRPPGTVVMSYPFGFGPDYRGFYFRSVFLPVVLIGAAVFVAGWCSNAAGRWTLAGLSIFLAALPGIYQFEVVPGIPLSAHWGLVDNFLAGVAALALAAAIRSARRRSLAWLAAAALLCILAMYTKPAGILLAGLVTLTWGALALVRHRRERDAPGTSSAKYVLQGATLLVCTEAAAVALARWSGYLSSENVSYGNAAIALMKELPRMTWPVYEQAVHTGIGYAFVAGALVLIPLTLWRWRELRTALDAGGGLSLPVLAASSAAVLGCGLWFWLVGSGGSTHIRYFTPFALVAATAMVPVCVQAATRMSPHVRRVLALLLFLPGLQVAVLLLMPDAPPEWQRWAGVNIVGGRVDPVQRQAASLVKELERTGRRAVLYSIRGDASEAAFGSRAEYARMLNPAAPPLTVTGPMDWQRRPTYRFDEITRADYLLFSAMDAATASATLARVDVPDFATEALMMQAWASTLTERDGIEPVSSTPATRLVRVADRQALDRSLRELMARHGWRQLFMTSNSQRWMSETEFARLDASERTTASSVLRDVTFASLLLVRKLTLETSERDLIVRLWWQPLSESMEPDWNLFVHTIDANGGILAADHIALGRVEPPGPASNVRLTVAVLPIRAAQVPFRVALGFVRANETPPIADRGERDWGGRRLLVEVR